MAQRRRASALIGANVSPPSGTPPTHRLRQAAVVTALGVAVCWSESVAVAAPAPLVAEGYKHGYAGLFRVGPDGRSRSITREAVDDVKLSPDGRRLAYIAPNAYAVRVVGLDGRRKRTLLRYGSDHAVFQVRWSPNGRRLALTVLTADETDPQVVVIDVRSATKRMVPTPAAPANGTHGFTGLTWARDSRRIAVDESMALRGPVEFMPAGHAIRILDADGGAPQTLTATSQRVATDNGLAFSPRGEMLAVGGERGIELWSSDGATQRTLSVGHVGDIAWSPDGKRLFGTLAPDNPGDRGGVVVDVANGHVRRITGTPSCWSPDGRRLCVRRGVGSGTIRRDGSGFRHIRSRLSLFLRTWAPSPN
jgi:Tol biopolymer transport system component